MHPVMDFPEFDAFILIVNCVLSPPRKHLFFFTKIRQPPVASIPFSRASRPISERSHDCRRAGAKDGVPPSPSSVIVSLLLLSVLSLR